MREQATTLIIFDVVNHPYDYEYACDAHAAEWGEGAAYVGPADIVHPCCFCAAPEVENDAKRGKP